jgi:hypothetical protein
LESAAALDQVSGCVISETGGELVLRVGRGAVQVFTAARGWSYICEIARVVVGLLRKAVFTLVF